MKTIINYTRQTGLHHRIHMEPFIIREDTNVYIEAFVLIALIVYALVMPLTLQALSRF